MTVPLVARRLRLRGRRPLARHVVAVVLYDSVGEGEPPGEDPGAARRARRRRADVRPVACRAGRKDVVDPSYRGLAVGRAARAGVHVDGERLTVLGDALGRADPGLMVSAIQHDHVALVPGV